MKQQLILFFKYFLSVQDGTNEKIKESNIKEITFNPEFHKYLVKQKYIKKKDTSFRGFPFVIDYEQGADYWGMFLEPKDCKKNLI